MRKTGSVLIAMGVAFWALVVGLNLYSEYKYKTLMDGYIRPDNSVVTEGTNNGLGELYPSSTIGIIEIPEIGLKNPILDGVGSEVLRVGVGRFIQSDPLGSTGTSTLIGHNKYILNQPFKNLDKLKIGDKINIIVEDKTYIYEVKKTYTVLPSNRDVLKVEEGYPALVLITCTDSADRRYVVQAAMVNEDEAKSLEELEALEEESLEEESLEEGV